MCIFAVLLDKLNSAEHRTSDVAPQSKYVSVRNDGVCCLQPFFVRSDSHCSMDSTWFPFDKQYCDLVFESWRYPVHELNLTTYFDGRAIQESHFLPNGLWEIIGRLKCVCCIISSATVYFL